VVVVEPHLAVAQDVEPRVLLILDDDARRVVERLGVRRDLERLEQVLARQLMGEPGRPRVRADHRRREQVHGPRSYAVRAPGGVRPAVAGSSTLAPGDAGGRATRRAVAGRE
jgi:hypothetical protein